ncbi:MAG: HAMP domain-containing sensor histidine kinase [Rhodothermales bacterium]|nr:HAMP domain-containing sensor histidine kinase [Rhodothermales bacterium]
MQSYRLSTNLKYGLVLFAVLIAVASLTYTSRLVSQLRAREQMVIQLWASALQEITLTQLESINPFQPEFAELAAMLTRGETGLPPEQAGALLDAIRWAQSMPPAGEASFIANAFLLSDDIPIPSILADSSGPISWRNLPGQIDSMMVKDRAGAMERLSTFQAEMDAVNPPVLIEIDDEDFGSFRQHVHYGESSLIRELRIFPYAQLLFVGLFIAVGYFGFSYIRRNEQSNLWVGMAKEAAHQLGTPISSLMGWTELLRMPELEAEQREAAVDEIENDISRLKRVANRFSNIGSRPQLTPTALEPVVTGMVEYIRRRTPSVGRQVGLEANVAPDLVVPMNVELFEWVIENLLKNALDAIETDQGSITIEASRDARWVYVDVRDTGKGIDRRQWKNVFRPGYSTKKRGWGLGLSLAKRIVEEYHGGSLEVTQSRIGEGTTFRVALPAVVQGR